MLRISRAYCIELKKVVSIAQARREFFALESPIEEFHFVCDSLACIDHGVRISGVNYRVLAKDEPKYKAAHYKRLDPHFPGCTWQTPLAVIETKDPLDRQTIRRKLNDLIDAFDPAPVASDDVASPTAGSTPDADGTTRRTRSTRSAEISHHPGKTRTRDFERLVDSYLDARSQLTPAQFDSLMLDIVGIGSMRLKDYFKHVAWTKVGSHSRSVLFGGARVDKRFKTGIRLHFFDSIEGLDLKLFIPYAQLDAYRFRNYIRQPLEEVEKSGGYLTVYALGNIAMSKFGHYELNVPELRGLVIRMKPRAAPRPQGASAAST